MITAPVVSFALSSALDAQRARAVLDFDSLLSWDQFMSHKNWEDSVFTYKPKDLVISFSLELWHYIPQQLNATDDLKLRWPT